jgi:large subunit ribosomal protein L32
MPPLPKRKVSKGRRDRRRAHDALSKPTLVECPQCHNKRLAHRVCPNCGMYRSRAVLASEEKE